MFPQCHLCDSNRQYFLELCGQNSLQILGLHLLSCLNIKSENQQVA